MNWLRTWLRRKPASGRQLARTSYSPRLEELEDRTVLTGTLVASSYFDSALYEFDATSGKLLNTLVAPYSQSVLAQPAGVTVGPDGNLYLSSQTNNSIVQYDVGTHGLSTFIDSATLGAIATANGDAQFSPAGLRFGPDGNLYVALNGGRTATSGGAVIRFNISNVGGELHYSGTERTIAAGLIQPTEMVFGAASTDVHSLYVSNSAAGNVIKIAHADGSSPTKTVFVAANKTLNYPSGLSFGPGGNLYVEDLGATTFHGQVLRYSPAGKFLGVFTQPSSALQFQFPSDLVFSPDGSLLTADLGPGYPPGLGGSIAQFNAKGAFVKFLVSSGQFPNTGPGTSGISPSQLTMYPELHVKGAAGALAGTFAPAFSLTLGSTNIGLVVLSSWTINWGDGTPGHPDLQTVLGSVKTVTHRYKTPGTYTITATAKNSHGTTYAAANTVTVMAVSLPFVN